MNDWVSAWANGCPLAGTTPSNKQENPANHGLLAVVAYELFDCFLFLPEPTRIKTTGQGPSRRPANSHTPTTSAGDPHTKKTNGLTLGGFRTKTVGLVRFVGDC